MHVSGEVVSFRIYDTGGEIDLSKVKKIFGQKPEQEKIEFEQLAPKYINISPAPLFVNLKKRTTEIFGRKVELSISARIYEVGAVSVILRISFSEELKNLVDFSKPFKISGKDDKKFSDEIFAEIIKEIKSCISKSYEIETYPEEYMVFCVREPNMDGSAFLNKNRETIAGILREEKNFSKLFSAEIRDATRATLSYFKNDLVIIDWSVGMIFDPTGKYEDDLLTIELANLQLLELRTYDKLIDKKIESAYKDLKSLRGFGFLKPVNKVMLEIAEMRMEMTRYIEDTMNITKFFGDYYLAKLYDLLEERLHIDEWQKTVSKKLDNLDEIYELAADRVDVQKSTWLEVLIVLLIVFEIVLALGGKLW